MSKLGISFGGVDLPTKVNGKEGKVTGEFLTGLLDYLNSGDIDLLSNVVEQANSLNPFERWIIAETLRGNIEGPDRRNLRQEDLELFIEFVGRWSNDRTLSKNQFVRQKVLAAHPSIDDESAGKLCESFKTKLNRGQRRYLKIGGDPGQLKLMGLPVQATEVPNGD
ncbi:MAG: hypothetical protein QE278_04895 [Limnobacter sp.]|nr:hypothetical protein [Limnobacter sp.]